ncbi:MAG: hypothetical protein WD601_02595, partial [Pseudohongiellaceae bacterium]
SIKTGADVDIEGPYGALFDQAVEQEPELWIAGGIGITPFLSRARDLQNRPDQNFNIILIYCVQDEARALFYDELANIALALPGFDLCMHYFYREGPLSAEFLKAHCTTPGRRHTFICGPPPLLNLARRVALNAAVPRNRIHTEEFDLL